MDNDVLLGNIRAELARRRMKQTDLATIWGVSEMSASRRLNGHISISVDELREVAAAFGMEASDLLTESKATA